MSDSIKQCPQCLHHNPTDASSCELCDWPIGKVSTNENPLPNLNTDIDDSNATIAPDSLNSRTADSDVTVAPTGQADKQAKIAEQHTFHLAGDLAHFEIIEILGQGGMGAVYHAKDRTLQRYVAIKMLRPLAGSNQLSTEALLDEARMASQLNHPNIVTIYDVARTANSNYIVMEWVDGKSLDELIPEDGLELETAINYARQIAHGLSSAHQKYIIHRDIKPQNIMLSEQNTLKILDFGIAGLVEHIAEHDETAAKEANLTTPAAGTPSYMSPEQAQGLNLDPRSDIFSLGIVLYQMLTGKRPFFGNNNTEVKQAICAGRFTPIENIKADLPAEVVHTVNKMLATAKDQRWQSSVELAAALDEIYNKLTHTKNWWQKRHWLTQVAMLLPFIVALGWTTKNLLFPASTQQLIEQQLAEATKVAILPFNNISGDPLLQLFSDGLAVNLGSDLSAIANEQGNTWIVPATEISRMQDPTPKSVTDKYGVNLILTGSIQHMGSTRLMVLNLLDASNGQLMKTAEVEIEAEKLFEGHDLIRQEALDLLSWRIPETVQDRFEAQRPQLDGAYSEYIKGVGYYYRFDQPNALTKAVESFNKAIEMSPDYALAYIGLAESQLLGFRQTRDVSWLKLMETTIASLSQISSDRCQVDYLKAELLTRKGEYQQAIKLFKSCLIESPKHTPSYLGLANAYAKSGNNELAANHYKKAIEITPNNVKSMIDFYIFNYSIGNYEKTIELATQISEIAPNNVAAYIYLGASYHSLGEIDKAIEYSLKALKLKPTGSGYSNLATMYFSKRDYSKSVEAFEKAIELNPSHYVIWGNLADAYKLTNSEKTHSTYEKAAAMAVNAMKVNPKDTSLIANLSYYLSNTKNKSDALSYALQIGELNTGWENFKVALAYDNLNRVNDAMSHLRFAIDKNYSVQEIKSTPLLVNARNNEGFNKLFLSKL